MTADVAAVIAACTLVVILVVDVGRVVALATRQRCQLRRIQLAQREANQRIDEIVRRSQTEMVATLLAMHRFGPRPPT